MDGLILAGGKSMRMGGRHKGDLVYRNHTFIEHIIREFKKETEVILISCGKEIHREYEGCKTLTDIYSDCGPIGGLHAGCSHLRPPICRPSALPEEGDSEPVMVAACDMPFLEIDLYRFLKREMEREEYRRSHPVDGVVPIADGRIHPLAAIYRKRAGAVFKEQIVAGEYRLAKALKRLDILYVDILENVEMCGMLRNINTIREYERL